MINGFRFLSTIRFEKFKLVILNSDGILDALIISGCCDTTSISIFENLRYKVVLKTIIVIYRKSSTYA